MSDTPKFWEVISPYLSYLEENYLDLDSITTLVSVIKDPALVIGAGQGLLVEELRKQGHTVDGVDSEPQMIKLAAQRRGINLVLAQGNKMPFLDDSYRTSIIATGVIDFMDDKDQIRSIVLEAKRVTREVEHTLVAFYRWDSAAEELGRFMGIITPENRWRMRRMYELLRLKPFGLLKAVTKAENVGLLTAFFTLVRLQMSLPKKAKQRKKRFSQMFTQASNVEELIECLPDSLPYWNEESINSLFAELDIGVRETLTLESCFVVKV